MAFDITSRAFLEDPGPILQQMRRDGPIVAIRIPLIGRIWVTTTDAAARHVLKSPELFVRDSAVADGRTLAQRFWWLPPFMKPLLQNMLATDGEAHKRLRGLVETAFARTSITDLRPRIEVISNELLDQLAAGQTLDIQKHFARPLPLQTICEMMGITQAERDQIAHWITPISGPTSGWTMLRALPGLWRIMRHFEKDFERVRETPRQGLISDLVHADIGGDKLSREELLAMVVTLFIAGHETTVHLISNGIHGLLQDRDAMKAMTGDKAQVSLLIEEFMRHSSPVMMTKPHFVTKDTDYEGIRLKKGDQIAALLIGANHDPDRFEAPEKFIPARRPNPHLGFGHGPHVCLGMQLARAEAEVALTTLFDRFPNMTLVASPTRSRRTGIHGFNGLQVTL